MLHIASTKDGSSWNVMQLQVTDWPQDGVVIESHVLSYKLLTMLYTDNKRLEEDQ